MTRLTKDKFEEMLHILEEITEQFRDCGPEEWDSLDDAINATTNNLKYDLEDIK